VSDVSSPPVCHELEESRALSRTYCFDGLAGYRANRCKVISVRSRPRIR
jgi:hypothetical protein